MPAFERFGDLLGFEGIGVGAGVFVSGGRFAFERGGPAAKHEVEMVPWYGSRGGFVFTGEVEGGGEKGGDVELGGVFLVAGRADGACGTSVLVDDAFFEVGGFVGLLLGWRGIW